jgi:hypothetical protein
MAKTIMIMGNGFDVDLGLKSRYTDFLEGEEWKRVCNIVEEKFSQKFQKISLLMHMLKASKDTSRWFDVENEIHKFIKTYPIRENEMSGSFAGLTKEEFIMLKRAIYDYLARISKEYILDKSKWAYVILQTLCDCKNNVNLFTFNYTNCCSLCKLPQLNCTYIHGNLEDDDIVLGCEELQYEHLPRPFSFLIKSNMITRPNNIIEELFDASEVIFYGHSFNAFDFSYFEEFFSRITYPIDHSLYLTIVTRDQESELNVRNNLREQGISIQNLFKSNIITTFIHTEPNDRDKTKHLIKWNNLLNRIRGDNEN